MANPIVPTPPVGDSSNRAADTAFVGQAIASAINIQVASAIASAIAGLVLVSTTQVDFLSGVISGPINSVYRVIENSPFAMTLTGFSAETSTGSVTATLGIGLNATATLTAVTGGSFSVGTAQVTSVPTALNTVAAGGVLGLTITNSTTPQNLSFVVKFTRTLS